MVRILSKLTFSAMVEAFLAAIATLSPDLSADTPVLDSVRASLKKADLDDYGQYLASKLKGC
jgi:hypothetical protein